MALSALLAFSLPVFGGIFLQEFMAENDGGLRDEDGDSPDWIELYNDSDAPLSLAGWRLTDDPANPAKWSFPATNLPSLSYLIVFASGKNRAVPGGELHTNFRLQNAGGYLALLDAQGTPVSVYSNYPPQRANVTYGRKTVTQITSWIATNTAYRWKIMTNPVELTGWNAPGFDASSWPAAAGSMGFSSTDNILLRLDFDERGTTPVTQPGFESFVINSNTSATAAQSAPTVRWFGNLQVTLSNTPPDNYDDRLRSQPVNSGTFTLSALLRDFVFSGSRTNQGGLDLTISGLPANQACEVTLWSYDNSSPGSRRSTWSANGVTVVNLYAFDGTVLPVSDNDYRMQFSAMINAQGQLKISGRRDPSSVGSGGAADYGVFLNALEIKQPGLAAYVQNDIRTLMRGRSTSLAFRHLFTTSTNVLPQFLRLRVRYKDGFAAWLNGLPLVARNAPAEPAWDARALSERPLAEAAREEEIVIPASLAALQPGTNVLAIQAMSYSTNTSHFLFSATLEGFSEQGVGHFYFPQPTPAAPNATGYQGFVSDTKFSVDRGFYDTPFTVAITSATPGALIYYTTDGSRPSPTNGSLYQGPLLITNTTLLRAAAWAEHLIPTEPDTHSYIFLESVLRQPNTLPGYPTTWQASYPADYEMDPNVVNHPRYSNSIRQDLLAIPTVSMVTEHDSLWGAARGIYLNSTSVHDPATGQDWERAASVELILPDGRKGFQANCGIRIQGNASRDNNRLAKHSVRLLFKSEYGPSKLRYDWFGGGVQQFDNLILRAGFTDTWATRYSDQTAIPGGKGTRYRPEDSLLLRDGWVKDSMRDMGHLAARHRFVHLYLNGLYWGVYNPSERMDASYCAEHLGGSEQDWDVLCGDAIYDFATLKDGFKDDWNELMALVNAGITNEAAFQAITQRVDVANLIDYMILHIVAEAEDWPHHNWYAVHRRANPRTGLPATPWIFLPWDQEIVLDQLVRRNRVEVNNPDTPARIYGALRAWPEFRRMFGDRVHKHLFNHGALTPEKNIARLMARVAEIDRAIVGESARWGDAREFTIGANPGHGQTFTRDEWWWPEIEKLRTNYFPTLTEINVARFRAAGLYPALAAPQFSRFGGEVAPDYSLTLSHTNLSGTIFYTLNGEDPRVYGSGMVAASALTYQGPITITDPVRVMARVFAGGQWSALAEAMFYPTQNLQALTLTEVMYNPPAAFGMAGELFEFVELWNRSSQPLNLSGFQFIQGIQFTFTNGTRLAPHAYAVLVADAAAFALKYPGVPVLGVYTGRLDNGGERITLADPRGAPVLSLNYDDVPPWPLEPDNGGYSLVQRYPLHFQAPEDPLKWRASAAPGGSPGAPDGDDMDSDGLPDAWEIQHGLISQNPTDAMEDPDGDGHSNLEEYLAGTDPRDPRSHVRLRLEHHQGQLTLSGLQTAGRNVHILYRSNLWSGAWETWTNLSAPANAQEWRLNLPGATEGQRFYRLQVTWP
ncbi:lamin tail domain-containing protein [Fontisphaera persica]|uniref:lamin tail domain-containing protein n=1 Tax=Fontisphaera persica TaxID=2974023 RepID=UPI0024BF1A86|nr:lamin tail domain-containing protein [Fontisphaera persica]WCJ60185.1 lamin tail domain-containing protein [Fontisphaera persica]